MTYQVRVMDSAQTDMREIHRYISEDLQNPEAAVKRIKLLEKNIRSLKKMLVRFPLVTDDYLASKGMRVIVVKTHLIFFVVRETIKKVSVMRILHARRDWARILRI
ncbi:MAG: type II toxin-antitoxin system RelE/ParE family toxin [Defluviitaleaceae bacterium]|nr:type II toxin-antitoxin system RelE/ParE family toxin [Defluviitaleaceae bacterium]